MINVFTFLIALVLTFIAVLVMLRKLEKQPNVLHVPNIIAPGLKSNGIVPSVWTCLKQKIKCDLHMIPIGGGIAIGFGMVIAILISLRLVPGMNIAEILAAVSSIALVSLMGLTDDLLHFGKISKVILPIVAALPLMAVKAGTNVMVVPFIGELHLGALYYLIVVPLTLIGVSNLFNLLAGYDGLTMSTGSISAIVLLIAATLIGSNEASTISLALLGACLAFLWFNKPPAKIIAGNVGTFLVGSTIASIAIIGNMESVLAILLIPQLIDFFPRFRALFRTQNCPTHRNGEKLIYRGQINNLAHALMKWFQPSQIQLVLIIAAMQIISGILALLVRFG